MTTNLYHTKCGAMVRRVGFRPGLRPGERAEHEDMLWYCAKCRARADPADVVRQRPRHHTPVLLNLSRKDATELYSLLGMSGIGARLRDGPVRRIRTMLEKQGVK